MKPLLRDRYFLIILACALAVRLVVWSGGLVDSARYMAPDSYDYMRLARGLWETGHYGTAGQPEIFRVPGYPVFLALIFTFTSSKAMICLFQLLLGTAVCGGVGWIAHRLYGARAALFATAFQATSAVSVTYAARVLSETLFTFLFVCFLVLMFHYDGDSDREDGGFMGGVMGLMSYARAVALPLSGLPFLFMLWRKHWRNAVFYAVAFLLCITPWFIRNWTRADYPHFSSVGSINIYRYNAAMVRAGMEKKSFGDVQRRISEELGTTDNQREAAELAARRGRQIISAHPFTYAAEHLKTIPSNLLPVTGELLQTFGVEIGSSGTLAVVRSDGILAGIKHYFGGKWTWFFASLPLVGLLGAVYLLAVVGFLNRASAKNVRAMEVFLILALAYFLLVPGGAAHPRFRVPAMPAMSVFAGYGMHLLLSRAWTGNPLKRLSSPDDS